jgi:hypothetical protein
MSSPSTWNSSAPPAYGDEFDFILDVCGIRAGPDNDPPSDPSSGSSMNGSVSIELDGEKHIFRHAKEVQKGSRGGYLKGTFFF